MGKQGVTQNPAICLQPRGRAEKHGTSTEALIGPRPAVLLATGWQVLSLLAGRRAYGDQTVTALTMIEGKLPAWFLSIRQSNRMGHGSMK
jgi:hypothetical protein